MGVVVGLKLYSYDEWDFIIDEKTQDRTYIDLDGNKITGMLENFFYFKKGDKRNDQYVRNGKRSEFPKGMKNEPVSVVGFGNFLKEMDELK